MGVIWDSTITDLNNRLEKLRAKTKITTIPVVNSTPTGTPQQVTNVSATESPHKTNDGSVKSLVSVSFVANPSDTFFTGVQI